MSQKNKITEDLLALKFLILAGILGLSIQLSNSYIHWDDTHHEVVVCCDLDVLEENLADTELLPQFLPPSSTAANSYLAIKRTNKTLLKQNSTAFFAFSTLPKYLQFHQLKIDCLPFC